MKYPLGVAFRWQRMPEELNYVQFSSISMTTKLRLYYVLEPKQRRASFQEGGLINTQKMNKKSTLVVIPDVSKTSWCFKTILSTVDWATLLQVVLALN